STNNFDSLVQENINNPATHEYMYLDFSTYYTWTPKHKWAPRQISAIMLARLYMVQPLEGEYYYLRCLLTCAKGATSFYNLRTINGHMYVTFKEACFLLDLFQDNAEWDTCLLDT
ncbi:15870_t:CDS:1, partial [Dentiscutata erythropus]